MRVTCRTRERRIVRWVLVTVSAGRPLTLVRAGVDREPGVVEDRSGPSRRVMTSETSGRESRRDVVRVRHAGEVRLVTGIAIRRRSCVASANVTTGALYINVRSGQRERRFRVIEVCWNPSARRVTYFASLRKTCSDVIRISRLVEIRQVAR